MRLKSIEDFYPLSPLQSGLLFHSLYAPDSAIYVGQFTCILQGQFDTAAFRRAWESLIERQSVLRTGFIWSGLKEPVQAVHRQVKLPWEECDWRTLSEAEQRQQVTASLQEDRQKGFQLEKPPLMRVQLFRLGDSAWRLIWSHHHLLLDGWSLPLLLKELMLWYRGHTGGQPLQLEPPRPYREYITWLHAQNLSHAEAYWREKLAGFTAPTPLPMDQAYRAQRAPFDDSCLRQLALSRELTDALDKLARNNRLTLNVVFQAAWALLLSRHSGEKDVVFGTTVSGRSGSLRGIDSMIGLFINALPVRAVVDEDATLLPWLKQLQVQQGELLKYEYTPLLDIHGWSDVPRSVSLFDSLLGFENHPVESALPQVQGAGVGPLTVSEVRFAQRTNFPLFVKVMPGPEFLIEMHFDKGRFTDDGIECLLDQFQQLLRQFVQHADRPLREYSLVTPQARHILPTLQTVLDEPAQEFVPAMVERWAKTTPEQVAIQHGKKTCSYSQLDAKAKAIAAMLASSGLKRGDVVALRGPRCIGMMASMLGVLSSGKVLLSLDRQLPKKRQQVIMDESAARAVIQILTSPDEQPDQTGVLQFLLDTSGELIHPVEPHMGASEWEPVGGDDAAYIFFTSGTTGVPKGVLGRHKGLSHFLSWQRDTFGIEPQDRAAQLTGLSFDVVLRDVFLPLISGATLCIPENADEIGPDEVPPWLKQEKITVLHTVPSLAQSWLASHSQEVSLETLRWVFFAGEPLADDLVHRWRETFSASAELVNLYGPTETTLAKCFYRVPRSAVLSGIQPVGATLPNCQAFVLSDSSRQCGIGEPGEIVIRTPFRSGGYINSPQGNHEKFFPNPARDDPHDLLYRSGDRGRFRPDGALEVLGRIDDQVKIRGVRVEPSEIMSVLLQHPGVHSAFVIARRDKNGQNYLVAYLVPTSADKANAQAWRDFLGERLPAAMVPSAFVFMERLPLTPNGKVDRKSLPEPDLEIFGAQRIFTLPRTPVEELLVDIWRELLVAGSIGIHDNFFDKGGHSLLATRLASRVRSAFHIELPLRYVFELPTIAGLAERIESVLPAQQRPQVPPLVSAPRDKPLLLSFAQQRLWFLDQLAPGNPFYNVPVAVRVRSPLDVPSLDRSFSEIIRRHESLRTTFSTVDGQPVQVVHTTCGFRLSLVDLMDVPEASREAEMERLATEAAQQPFDLARGPLLRVVVFRLAESDHVVLFVIHHIVSDAWSMGVLIRELAILYRTFLTGRLSPLSELPVQYPDYAAWQREWLRGDTLQEQLAYWKKQLAGVQPLALPVDRPRPAIQSFRGSRYAFSLSAELSKLLRELSRRERATSFMTLLAGFQCLLSRYSGQADIAVGTPSANRTRSDIEGLIGFFVNTLVLRTDLSGNPTFREIVSQVRDRALQAYAHQELPFEMLVDELQPDRDMSRQPLFQVMFALQHAALQPLELPSGLKLESMEVSSGMSRFDLTLFLWEGTDRLRGTVEYSTDLFDESTIARMMSHFHRLLEAVAAQPEMRLSELPLLDEAEEGQLLRDWAEVRTDYPCDARIDGIFSDVAARMADKIAVVHGAEHISYGELNRRADKLADYLRSLGTGLEDTVAICTERCSEMIIGWLAILKAGGAYLPLDSTYPKQRLAAVLQDAGVQIVVTQMHLRGALPECDLRVVEIDADWPVIEKRQGWLWRSESDATALSAGASRTQPQPPDWPQPPLTSAENLAYVIFTSGSTGQPKGVAVAHRAVVRLVMNTDYVQVTDRDRVAQASTSTFDAATFEVWGPLLHGGCVVIIPKDVLLSAELLEARIREEDISVLFVTTALFNQHAISRPHLFQSLKHLLFGGEAVTPQRVREVTERGRPQRLLHVYGPTETTTFATWYEVESVRRDASTVSIGRPIANTRVLLLDSYFQPVPQGVTGEMYIGGPGLARNYVRRPDWTAEKFVPDPFATCPGARLYRTGDLSRWLPDGTLQFLGRFDNQVKLRGFRIELGEIESVLKDHPAVQEAVVEVREDLSANKRLVAYLVSNGDSHCQPAELRRYLASKLPDYMVPSAFMQLEKFPLTDSGKVNRQRLPDPEFIDVGPSQAFEAPRTLEQIELARIWSEVLGIERVGIHHNFFELGGNSLLATQLISRIRVAFQVDLPLRQVFGAATIAGLADVISRARRTSQMPPITPVSREGGVALSFAQQRLWFLDQLVPNNSFYNVPANVRLIGPLDIPVLHRTLNEIVRRHETLRTTFPSVDGKAVQVVSPPKPLRVSIVDISSLPEPQRDQVAADLAAAEGNRPFRLQHGPMLRVIVLRLAAQDHAVLLTMHHIISDGWSIGVLVHEVAVIYRALLAGEPSPLPELAVQYADFAAWQRKWLVGPTLDEQLAYWKDQLADLTPLQLPTDRPRPRIQSFQGARRMVRLPRELSAQLQDLSNDRGSTLFMTLLAAFQCLLHRYSGQDDIAVGTAIANRTRTEIETLIGFFVNTLVLRTDVAGKPTFYELLDRVREAAMQAYAHQDLPFEMLVEKLEPERDLSRQPLFQVMFALQNAPLPTLEIPGGLTLRTLEVEGRTSKFDLFLSLWGGADGIWGYLEYGTELFDPSTIDRMWGHFQRLLVGIVANPEMRVARLPLLADDESEFVRRWALNRTEYPSESCIHELFEDQARRTPDAVAASDGDRQLTYDQLNRRANQLAHYQRWLGVGSEDRVAICMERSLEMVTAILSTLKAGAAYVPIDPAYPAERLNLMLDDSAARVILTQSHIADMVSRRAGTIICVDEGRGSIAIQSDVNPSNQCFPDSIAYVMYTSGSTGVPKGVEVPHRGVVRLLFGTQYITLSPAQVLLHLSSTCFDASTLELWGPLLHGGRCVLLPHKVPTAEQLAIAIRNHGVNTLWLTASLFNAITDESSEVLRSVEQLLIGGESLSVNHVQRFMQQVPTARVINGYGPTESTTFACCYPIPDILSHQKILLSIPIGRPIANTSAYILDEESLPTPIGVPGELCIGGAGLARGYLNNSQLTASRFVPHPLAEEPGARLYRTGDSARWLNDGTIQFLGRRDHQVKLRGFRIELGEIEAALRNHSAVRDAVVLAREDVPGHKRLVGYVVPETGYRGSRQSEPSDQWQSDRIAQWQQVYDVVIYEQIGVTPSRADPTFNIAGWESSYTGQPLPAEAMREQVDQTVARIAARRPRRILEIGCGTGLLLFPLAPQCETYVGTDFSAVALDHVKSLIREGPQFSHVNLLQRLASDFEGLEPDSFDAVILNSVVQYFPSIEYLVGVLEGAVRVLAPQGFIFVGDVRNLALLSAFRTAVELYQGTDSLSRPQLLQRLRRQVQAEQELVVSPDFFWAFSEHLPQLERVEIQLKRGRQQNELTQFRYDVVLQVGERPPRAREATTPAIDWSDWRHDGLTLESVRRRLEESAPDVWAIRRVPNARVSATVAAWRLLCDEEGPATVDQVRERSLATTESVDPEDIWVLEEQLPYRVSITWSASPDEDCMDVLFSKRPESQFGNPFNATRRLPLQTWQHYASNPLQALFNKRLVPQLREYLESKLPEYMVPSALLMMDRLPVTRSGKVDRSALPTPEEMLRGDEAYAAPRTPAEEKLTAIWSQLLGLQRVGIHDNFFELGGDSIISIQIIARASQAGLQLTPQQIFQHQTIAELAAMASPMRVTTPQGVVAGPVKLTPIQHWFFEQRMPVPQHFNQSFLLDVPRQLNVVALQSSLRALLAHHDALRLRFSRDGQAWRQSIIDVDDASGFLPFHRIDVGALNAPQRSRAIEDAAANVQTSLDLVRGPLLRVVLFEAGSESSRLLVVVHHLAIDGVSWRILLDALVTGYQQAVTGKSIQLPAKTTSLQQWAAKLDDYADSDLMEREIAYWRDVVSARDVPFPTEGEGPNDFASSANVRASLTAEETESLLREVPAAYRTQINDVLLTALVLAIGQWTGHPRLLLDLEGHGREELFDGDDVDLSRTVGWFTSIFPVRLDCSGASNLGEALKTIKEQLRQVPNRGIGYGVLRYLRNDSALSRELAVTPPVSFNYLGQFDQVLPEHFPFGFARESPGPMQHRQMPRAHLVDVSGNVVGGQLAMRFTYSPDVHQRQTVQRLSDEFLKSLRNLIRHCQSPDAGGCTPADFPLARLDQSRLNRLVGRGRDVEDLYPLSPLQSGLLYHSLEAPEAGLYVEQLACTLEGVDIEAFRSAWQQAIDRHVLLRTSFAWTGLDEPVQIVHRRVLVPWQELDWRGVAAGQQNEQLEDFLREDRRRGFEMTKPPLMRLTLIRLNDQVWRFIWSHHHLLLDGWSLPVLLKELMLDYECLRRGISIPLEPARSFRDYIAWLLRQDASAAESYWRTALKGFLSPVRLGIERSDSTQPVSDRHHGSQTMKLSEETTSKLDQFARNHGLTLNTVIQGAWSLLLALYSGRDDVVFGTTVSGRSASIDGIGSMVGLFINALPVRVQVSGGWKLLPWLKQLQTEQAELRSFEFCPLVQIQAWSEIPPGVPLFHYLLAFENFPVDRTLGQEAGGTVQVRDIRLEERVNYPLGVIVSPGSSLSVRMLFHLERFHADDIHRLLGHYQRLLETIVADPDRPLCQLSPLAGEEREQLLFGWNETAHEYPDQVTADVLFLRQVRQQPDATAVVDGPRQLSYGQLNLRANRVAHYLRHLGVGPESRVGVCVGRSLEMVVGLLGILKAGGAYVPLDPLLPEQRLAGMIKDAGLTVVLSEQTLLRRSALGEAMWVTLDADWAKIALFSSDDPGGLTVPENLAYVIFTSGSTGRPKGTELMHRGLCNLASAQQRMYPLGPGSRVLQFASLSFDASIWEVAMAVFSGATLVLASNVQLIPGVSLESTLHREQITVATMPPSVLSVTAADVPLATVTSAGEQCPRTVASRWSREHRFVNAYGPTESTVCATAWPYQEDEVGTPPIGRPIANTQVYVLNRDFNAVPVGVSGELYLGGIGLARGYLGRSDLTAEKFIPHPFGQRLGERLYRTGDLARWRSDGNLEFLGRLDQQVKIRGYRIELGEIEAVLSEYPDVHQVAIMARDVRAGEPYLLAYMGISQGAVERSEYVEHLQSYLRTKLPDYMIPSRWILLESLPLTLSGKVDRKALPEPAWERTDPYVAPRSSLERNLAQVWSDVLGVNEISVHDNFFELGGHSILAFQLMAQVAERLGKKVPLAAFVKQPTIHQMARILVEESGHPRLVTIQNTGSKRPLFCVHSGLGTVMLYDPLAQRLGLEHPMYGLEARGLDGHDEPINAIPTMATEYIEAIRSVQPQGPYYLLGHSAGGIVAFEMARQLRRLGATVAGLALLDSPSPRFYRGIWAEKLRRRIEDPAALVAGVANEFAYSLGKPPVVVRSDLSDLPVEQQIRYVLEKLRSADIVPPHADYMRGLLQVARGIYSALLAYEPMPDSQSRITLFRAVESHSGLFNQDSADPSWGWHELVGDVTIKHVAGDHFSMLSATNVGDLLESLKSLFDT